MTGYLIRRLGTAIIVILGITALTFGMLHLIALSPGQIELGPKATKQAIKAFNHQVGWDQPLWKQFFTYVGHVAQGNFGWSYKDNQSVMSLFKEKAPLSAFLSASSLALAIIIAIPLGIYQGVKRNSVGDITFTGISFALYSMPVFLFALVLIDIFALNLGWVDPNIAQDQSLSGALASWKDLILPIVALSGTSIAAYSRYQRSASLDVLTQDYIKVARAKGLSDRLVYSRHLIRNSALPMITLIGLSLPALIAGNVLVEATFNIDGLGLLFVKSLQLSDDNVLLGYTLLTAILTVLGNLIADICLTISDPRIRLV